jgi:hypothetical protein
MPVSRSTGVLTTNIAAGSNIPIPAIITGFDLIQRTVATLGTIKIYNGNMSGQLMAQGSVNTEVDAVSTLEFQYPIRCSDGANINLLSANVVIRYA